MENKAVVLLVSLLTSSLSHPSVSASRTASKHRLADRNPAARAEHNHVAFRVLGARIKSSDVKPAMFFCPRLQTHTTSEPSRLPGS
jgi:hypothetical protein